LLRDCIGVYWGAFDPLHEAHLAIIKKALETFHHLIIVVNNHSYKNYTYTLKERLAKIQTTAQAPHMTVFVQDDLNPIDFKYLKKVTSSPICAIAGYDAYLNWIHQSTSEERLLYQGIAVIPRGHESPHLVDKNAFLLEIDPRHKHISSTKEKKQ